MASDEQASRDSGSTDVDSLLREAVDISEPASIGPWLGLAPGDVLAGRFVVERRVGSGGMGTIHRATDLWTAQRVAIKVMATGRTGHADRFAREAVLLAELVHSAIVRYIAHGTTPRATQFLAMEWLEGEDLAARLARAREPLSVDETLVLIGRACAGMAAAHARGIVHRDIKPSNLFLVGRDPGALKVLDFGIARQTEGTRALTHSGAVLGTVGYMSPEQAMGARDVQASADVFALGCVLFECLTGRAAFVGPNAVAVLAKVLRDDPPRVSELRPGLGDALDELVARLLAKNPADRPKDAVALSHEFDKLATGGGAAVSAARSQLGLTAAEQKIVSVILGVPRTESSALADTQESNPQVVRELTRRFGAEPVAMRGGGMLVVLSGRGVATDQASQAARCALLLARLQPQLYFAIGTGRAETIVPVPVGPVIDRTAELLARSNRTSAGVAIDELTAGLLDSGFELRREGNDFVLVRLRADPPASRLLMGVPTPFVGREKELALLELTLRECIDESVARAVLVTGPAGQGKSRLQYELVAKVRGQRRTRILIARADPIGAGSSFLLVRQIVRQAMGLREGEDASELHARLRAQVGRVCSGADAASIAEFLGELIGTPTSEPPSAELRAARNDPQIMNVWLRRSFGAWLAAECAATPLLLVLEDLHWGDLPSVSYLGDALRALSARPLMLLALARPEVHETFVNLWAGTEMQEIALGRLTPRAAERLVRQALGDSPGARHVARIIERADGNPFYLEELTRRVAVGDSETLPETVIALVQTRLERLEPEARRVVRAASIFGELFRQSAVAAVLGQTRDATDLDAQLQMLVELEVLMAAPDTRFPGDIEYLFGHGLLREAAYAMLTDADRARGHELAGDWLEHAGEKDPLTLASHFELGGARPRAVPWLLRTAQAALDGGNVDGAIAYARRGIACGAESVTRGRLLLVDAEACVMRGDWRAVIAHGSEAGALLPAASPSWLAATAATLLAATFLGDVANTTKSVRGLLSLPVREEVSGPYGLATFLASQGLAYAGELETADVLVARAETLAGNVSEPDLVFLMWTHAARGYLQVARGELRDAAMNLSAARVLADRTGATMGRGTIEMYTVAWTCQTGHLERTTQAARAALYFCEPIGMQLVKDWVDYYLALAWTRGDAAEKSQSIAMLRTLLERKDYRVVSSVRTVLALALLDAGDVAGAEREIAVATARAVFPPDVALCRGIGALIELRLGRPQAALQSTEKGIDAAARGALPWANAIVRLARAQALHALDRVDEARTVMRDARERVLRVASTLDDPELRHAYLTNIDANRLTLEFAGAWLGESR